MTEAATCQAKSKEFKPKKLRDELKKEISSFAFYLKFDEWRSALHGMRLDSVMLSHFNESPLQPIYEKH